jgi:lipopolysaccharide transport system ATP-binding protein
MSTITVTHLGKAYKQYPNRWSRLAEWVLPGATPRHNLKWVMQDVSFSVQPGEAVGIIGINGAGKSTLLKMITGTTKPTTGSVHITGRVAALLELGMGFHADFTGRQNAFMAGQLLGYSMEEIASLMPAIEAFADIDDYIDQPVRVYSSGMQVRLAFAVATASRPDVLIIDEALSVGDAAFQRKCFQRIEDYQLAGTTLLFVSHDIETVKKICDRAVFIKAGQLAHYGAAKQVCDEYEKHLFGSQNKDEIIPAIQSLGIYDPSLNFKSAEIQYGNYGAVIKSVHMEDVVGNIVNILPKGHDFTVVYIVEFSNNYDYVEYGMMIKSVEGVPIYGTNTINKNTIKNFAAKQVVLVNFKLKGNLLPATYYLNVGVTNKSKDGSEFLHRRVDCLIFRVTEPSINTDLGYANLSSIAEISITNLVHGAAQ